MASPDPVALITQLGISGVLIWYVVRRLDKIQDTLAGLVQLYTNLITSLPDIKRRAKDDAEAVNKRVHDDK